MILLSFSSLAQCPSGVKFSNQGQVDYFAVAYPNCTTIYGNLILDPYANGPISNLNSLKKITTITGSIILTQHSVNMGNFDGLENLTKVGGSIYINDTWVNSISGLKNLTYVGGNIDISSNQISDFSALNNITYLGGSLILSNDDYYFSTSGLNLKVTNIPGDFSYYLDYPSNGNLNAIASIKTVGGNFNMSFDEKIKNLQGLNLLESVGGKLNISNCYSLTSLEGLSSLKSIGGLSLSNNPELIDISILNKITSLDKGLSISGTKNLNSLSGLNNIKSIGGRLDISNNDGLSSINELSKADFKAVTYLGITSNPTLSLCQELNICNYLFSGREKYIAGNARGCLNYDTLIESCNVAWKNTITGNIKIDIDGNGCGNQVNDLPMKQNIVRVTDGTDTYTTYTDSNGDYKLYVPKGNYNVESYSPINYYKFDPGRQSVNFLGVGEKGTVDFCAIPSTILKDVKIVVIPSLAPRPGFETQYKILYTNRGTTTMNGTLDFSFDNTKMDFETTSLPVKSQIIGNLSWDYTNLLPFESREIILKFKVIAPPVVNSGDIIKMTATINPIVGDNTPKNNIFSLNERVINSFDPNDKVALGGNILLKENLYDGINYVIRFQNTGTASAINVKIEDVFDKQLDGSYLELIALSHPGRVQIKNNTAEFIFDGINLVDSKTDEPNSHGYVAFRIVPKYGTPMGYTIKNKASIYFDFNEPIITNTFSILTGIDTDFDGILDATDNCISTSNPGQADSDGDGIGDVCDDNIEINPPYSIGFDTVTLDSFWKTYVQNPPYSKVEVSDLYDYDGNGKTIKIESYYDYKKAMLISPRINKLAVTSQISFWAKSSSNYYDSYTTLDYGFMTNPNDPATFTLLESIRPTINMAFFTVDMTKYKLSYGKYFALVARGKVFYIDDFKYVDPTLRIPNNNLNTFGLHPNPATTVLNIESKESIDCIRIYNLNGKEVKKIIPLKNETLIQVQIENLIKGMYLLKIQSGKTIQTQKFIKN
jgi:hypothetical protein